jgi:FkbM family methyltransferase
MQNRSTPAVRDWRYRSHFAYSVGAVPTYSDDANERPNREVKKLNMPRQGDLIFDVGMHLGEDTDFYLKKGFRVVAFEANPTFVQHCNARFSEAVASGKLVIASGAVAPGTTSSVPFYINLKNTHWGTLNHDWVERNERRGAPSKMVEVPRIDILDYFRRYGVPYYLKIDIEGSDIAAAGSLLDMGSRPLFLSIETNINRLECVLEEIELLRGFGYRKFKPVQQETLDGTRLVSLARDGSLFEHVFEYGASGPFGNDLPGEWLDFDGCRGAYRRIFARYRTVGHLSPLFNSRWHAIRKRLERVIGNSGWHDVHASL